MIKKYGSQLLAGIVLISLQFAVISCKFETGHGTDDGSYSRSYLYSYSLADSSLNMFAEGEDPIILPELDEVMYEFTSPDFYDCEIRTYNYKNNIAATVSYLCSISYKSLSPDYKYLAHLGVTTLNRLNLNTGEDQVLIQHPESMLQGPPAYSGDGKYIIYLSNPRHENGSVGYDSFYVHLYSFETDDCITLDTMFLYEDDILSADFIDDSRMFYVSRIGYNNNYNWEIKYFIYENSLSPELLRVKSFIPPSDAHGYVRNIGNSEILVINWRQVIRYNFISNSQITLDNFSNYNDHVRRVKGTDKLIGTYENSIGIMNLSGELEKEYFPDIEDKILWINYDYEDGIIIFMVKQWFNN